MYLMINKPSDIIKLRSLIRNQRSNHQRIKHDFRVALLKIKFLAQYGIKFVAYVAPEGHMFTIFNLRTKSS